jgi:hypothetical protein
MPSIVTDPAVAHFVERVSNGVDSAADSIAGLMMRLVGRISRLELKVETQDGKIAKIDKLARAKPVRKPPPTVVETGIDVRDYTPVRIEHKVKRPRGRPKGARDSYLRPRRSGIAAPAPSSHILDPDWDR